MAKAKRKIAIHTVDALCGAGKTYQALEWAMDKAEQGEKVCIVQPTIALVNTGPEPTVFTGEAPARKRTPDALSSPADAI